MRVVWLEALPNLTILHRMSPRLCLLALVSFCSAASGEEWKPLFDGKYLAGWHPIGKGTWTLVEGVIAGRHDKSEPDYSHLVSDAIYGDFIVRFKFRSVSGNSGFYFRIDEDPKASSGVSGFQAEIDPVNDVGGLYETNGRGWVIQPKPDQVATWFLPGEWNEMTVEARGAKITVTVNGKISAQIDDPQSRRKGRLALQTHGGQECLVYFKDLQIQGDPVTP